MDNEKTNYSVARVVTHTRDNISKFERHNERKNETYSNMNVDLTQTQNNVYYKRCENTLNEKLKEFNSEESLRLLYVAITRAQKKLYITVSAKSKAFGKEIDQEPSIIFEKIL